MSEKIKEGYKKTKLGWIPDEWSLSTFGDQVKIISGKGFKANEYVIDGINLLQIENVRYGNIHFKETSIKLPSSYVSEYKDLVLHKGEIVLALNRPVTNSNLKIARIKSSNLPAILYQRVGKYKFINNKISQDYMFQASLILVRDFVIKKSIGSDQPFISIKDFSKIKIPLPPLSEQKKIAEILSTWDKAIETTQALIEKLQLRKKGLMQQLLSGEKRLPGFSGEWEEMKTADILDSAGNRVDTKPNEIYYQIGVRSHTKGIFYKEGVSGQEIGNKRVFWIEPGCFVLNIVFAWEHAIAKTTAAEDGMIASHRFPMYRPKKGILDLDFLLYYFKTPRGKYLLQLASPGGAGRNKTLGKTEFLRLLIPLPSMKEQVAIATFLTKADKEINQTQHYLEQLQAQKKGLMQQLLTGQKRVVV